MSWYTAVPMAVTAVLFAAGGTATLTRGWIMPWQRRHVVRERIFGWAQFAVAAALGLQLAGNLLADDPGVRSAVTMPGVLILLLALVLVTLSQREPKPH
jgi:hypothetical protein